MSALCEFLPCISSCWSLAIADESVSLNNGSVVSIIVLLTFSYYNCYHVIYYVYLIINNLCIWDVKHVFTLYLKRINKIDPL